MATKKRIVTLLAARRVVKRIYSEHRAVIASREVCVVERGVFSATSPRHTIISAATGRPKCSIRTIQTERVFQPTRVR